MSEPPRHDRPIPPPPGRAATATSAPSFPGTAELEREFKRVPDVNAARVVTDPNGRPVEIHILASSEKHPKQIVRDVQSVAIAAFGLEIDRRLVSVVQLEDATGSPDGEPRVSFESVATEQSGLHSRMQVRLTRKGQDAVGVAEGSIASSARYRLVAQATVNALASFERSAESLSVDATMLVELPGHSIAVTALTFATGETEEVVSGSAVVREAGELDAIARATLDAVNRRIAGIELKALEAF